MAKEIKDMTPKEIIQGVKSGKLQSCHYKTNAEYLQAITHRENMLRGMNPFAVKSRKTHCVRGHPLSGDNVYTRKNRPGTRECKKCKLIIYKKWKKNHGPM